MKKHFLFITLFLLLGVLLFSVQARQWTSVNNETIEGDFVRYEDNGETVIIKKSDGKSVRVKKELLCHEDLYYLNPQSRKRSTKSAFEEFDDSSYEMKNDMVSPEHRYALLIGINHYNAPVRSLDFCATDAKLLSETFQKIGFKEDNIFLLSDYATDPQYKPTRENIYNRIEEICSKMTAEDMLIISFSGHGVLIDGISYLCPSDTNTSEINQNILDSLISREWAYEQLDTCKAKQKLFIIDACREDLTRGGKSTIQYQKLDNQAGTKNHCFMLMASCNPGQLSWESKELQHGVFTYYFCEGLSGKAENEEKEIAIFGLADYVSSKTKYFVQENMGATQLPMFLPSGEMSNFTLVKNKRNGNISLHRPNFPRGKQAGESISRNIQGVQFTFRWCPPSDSVMDSNGEYMQGFWMMETELTQKQWKVIMKKGIQAQFVGKRPLVGLGDDYPMYYISYNDCLEYCKKLQAEGIPVSLPTEDQWEYACLAGTDGDLYLQKDYLNQFAWHQSSVPRQSPSAHQVAEKKCNPWGLYDMIGNVQELCMKQELPDSTPEKSNERIHNSVLRGGSFYMNTSNCVPSHRKETTAFSRNPDAGVRLIINVR